MAVETVITAAKLRIKYLGEEKDGKQTYISKTYSNISPEAADQDIYDVSGIISDLQTKAVYSVAKISDAELMEA
jgi:hypothetical protein